MKIIDFITIILHPWWSIDKVIEMLEWRKEVEWSNGLKTEDWLIRKKEVKNE